jgi:CheY-like chemotaxis protein
MTKRFLVVDDEPDVLLLVSANIGAWGHEAATASTLDEARTAIATAPPDILILDVSMPEMDGPTFLRHLRDDGLAPTDVFLLSAIPPDQLERIASELGVGWISKPFTAPSLRDALRHVLDD